MLGWRRSPCSVSYTHLDVYKRQVQRVAGGLNLVDATSIAGGVQVDISQTDVYYFSGQKCFAAEGGLWVALASPAAQERAQEIKEAPGSGRWIPPVLDFSVALKNSVKNQTLNTPSIGNLILWEDQVQWLSLIHISFLRV